MPRRATRGAALVAFCAVLATLGMASASFAQAPPEPATPDSSQTAGQVRHASTDYIVGPSDILVINVWDQPDLSNKYSIDADGTFTFPLVGRIAVTGLTVRQVEDALRKRLSAGYLKSPQISVAVDQYRSRRVFIVGEVRQPGTYTLTAADTSLVEALARAGSTTADAGGEAVIVRAAAGRPAAGPVLPSQVDDSQVTRVDLHQLQRGALPQAIVLRDGDTVFIPRGEKAYVFGQVRNPGAFTIDTQTTVLQALSLAGGVTERGATGRIKIVRMVQGKRVEIKAKLTDVIRAGDTVVVPERFF